MLNSIASSGQKLETVTSMTDSITAPEARPTVSWSNLFATDNLVENNIFRHLRHGLIVQNGATGNVYGYNYSLECYQGEDWLATDMNSHGAHTTMNLWEGNIGCKVYGDYAHGSSSYNTVFRNHVTRASTPSEFPSGLTQARRAIDLEVYNRYWNVVGNVLGKPAQSWTALDPGASRTAGSGQYVYTFGYFSDGDGSRDDATIVTDTHPPTRELRLRDADNSMGYVKRRPEPARLAVPEW